MLTGINYWPRDKAMYWWQTFDLDAVRQDFQTLARWKFKIIRIFLNWEDFQPQPEIIHPGSVAALLRVADTAQQNGMYLIPTFFCGHMSGINWLPEWMLDKNSRSNRFPIFSRNRLCNYGIRNFYTEEELILSQIRQLEAICTELKGHAAIYAYDLGNEASNLVVPPDRLQARNWLRSMVKTIKNISPQTPVTIGMHAEDLEEDRNLRPQDASLYCDFLSMHGYPIYLSWVENNLDPDLLPFLGLLTGWLGNKPVMIEEFGLPTIPVIETLSLAGREDAHTKYPLFHESQALHYYEQVLKRLENKTFCGALAWCYGDYTPSLWYRPPLDTIAHERYFGLFRHDGTPKQAVRAFYELGQTRSALSEKTTASASMDWLKDYSPDRFYSNPRYNLPLFFQKYKHSIQ